MQNYNLLLKYLLSKFANLKFIIKKNCISSVYYKTYKNTI